MDRTLRAAVLAALIGFAAVVGAAIFLGFDVAPAIVAGVAVAAMAGLLIWGAAHRAESFYPTDAGTRPAGSWVDPYEPQPDNNDAGA